MALPKPVVDAAAQLLVVPGEHQTKDLWLWEHTLRVMQLARMLALLPEAREIGGDQPNQDVVSLAALFADAGWAVQVRRGELHHWQILGRPTNDVQRELGVGALQERIGGHIPSDVAEIAVRAIRECNDRYTKLPEARVLSEAGNLDEIGIMYVLRQLRQFQAEGQSLDQLVVNWGRHLEYHYWDARINDCLRWETTRHVARERLRAIEQFMDSFTRDRGATDLQRALQNMGVDTSSTSNRAVQCIESKIPHRNFRKSAGVPPALSDFEGLVRGECGRDARAPQV